MLAEMFRQRGSSLGIRLLRGSYGFLVAFADIGDALLDVRQLFFPGALNNKNPA